MSDLPIDPEESRLNTNLVRKAQGISIWKKLFSALTDPKFTGYIQIELHGKDGRAGRVKSTIVRHEPDDPR